MKSYAPFFLLLALVLFSCNKIAHSNDPAIFDYAIKQYKAEPKKDGIAGDTAIAILKKQIRKVDPLYTADQLMRVADTFLDENNYTAAYRCFRLSNEIADDLGEKAIMGYDKLKMSELELQAGDYHSAQKSATDGLIYFKEAQPDLTSVYEIELNNTIGISFEYLGDYESALAYYKKVDILPNSALNHIIIQNNLAHIYSLEKRYDQALSIYNKLLSSKILKDSLSDYALVKDNYGYDLFKRNPSKGETMMLESAIIREKNNDVSDLPTSYLHLAEFYALNDKPKALEYADKAYKAAVASGNPDDKLSALAAKIKLKGKESGMLPIQYIVLDDSLKKVRSTAKNEFAKLRYDKTDAELDNAKYESWILIVTIILLLVISISAFIWYKIKKNRQLDEQRTTARFAKKLHDEVANDMYQAMAFAEHEDLSKDNIREILLENLEDIYGRTRNISKENGDIDTGKGYYEELRGAY